VAWGARIPGQAYATVGSDNVAGGRLAAGHLLESGRRRIAFLGNQALPEVAQRYAGFVQAHRRLGVAVNSRLVTDAHFSRHDAEEAAGKLVASGLAFDGAVCASDLIAISLIKELDEAGRKVPRDVSVVGFDDIPLSRYSMPRLTTIRQDIARGAEVLVDRALAAAQGKKPKSVEMPVKLVPRASSRPSFGKDEVGHRRR
jgi:DNA-binding LacI/PurR family transcriptional regulator